MKKLILVLFILFFSCSSYAQITKVAKFKRPMFVIDVFGGYSLPMHDLSGSNIGEYYSFTNYAVSNGINTGVTGKFSVYTSTLAQLRLTALLGYNHFWSSDATAYNIDVLPAPWPTYNFSPPSTLPGESYIRLNIPNAAIGLEYAFWVDPQLKNNFSVGLQATMSVITGRIYNTKYGQPETFNTLKSNVRFGFAADFSYNTRITENFGFNAGLKYNLRNILGKTNKQSSEDGYMYINDANDPSINPNINSSRLIGDFSLSAGVSFFIGTKH